MPVKASLHIRISTADGKSFLQSVYATPPYKLANITTGKRAALLELVIMSASPGVLDNDQYDMLVDIDAGSHLRLHTQSYQRIFLMKAGAVQTTRVSIAADASLTYLPHPCVPHEGAIFKIHSSIYLKESSKLFWGEIITCGRKLRAEQFTFSSYHSLTKIFLEGRLLIKENLLMEPADANLLELGLLEGYTHQATMICIDNFTDVSLLMDAVHARLQQEPGILFGLSKAQKGFVIRALGYKGEQLFDCWQQVADLIRNYQDKLVKSN